MDGAHKARMRFEDAQRKLSPDLRQPAPLRPYGGGHFHGAPPCAMLALFLFPQVFGATAEEVRKHLVPDADACKVWQTVFDGPDIDSRGVLELAENGSDGAIAPRYSNSGVQQLKQGSCFRIRGEAQLDYGEAVCLKVPALSGQLLAEQGWGREEAAWCAQWLCHGEGRRAFANNFGQYTGWDESICGLGKKKWGACKDMSPAEFLSR